MIGRGFKLLYNDNNIYFSTLYDDIVLEEDSILLLLRFLKELPKTLKIKQDNITLYFVKVDYIYILYVTINDKISAHIITDKDIDFIINEILQCTYLQGEPYYKILYDRLNKTYRDIIITLRG